MPDRKSLDFELGVDARRRESPLPGGTDHGALARATVRWERRVQALADRALRAQLAPVEGGGFSGMDGGSAQIVQGGRAAPAC